MNDIVNIPNRLEGVFLGTVLKHLPHGRCKIYIPAAYHEVYDHNPDYLPSALQATTIFAGNHDGNGVFSYPNIGSTVICFFLNGDANFPIYFASLQGGENAFGQYEIIKNDLEEENGKKQEKKDKEDVSDRHLITSGKTHIKWFEKGKLCAIVEDPIRTICSVDYDSWELGNNNISDDNKYKTKLSNDNVWKIRDNKLSNIDCQFVLDNDAEAHGKLSASTHWYDILDGDNDWLQKGTISTDNWFMMHNDGEIAFGTLSSMNLEGRVDKTWDEDNEDQTRHISAEDVNNNITVNNTYSLSVPGIMDHKVQKIGTIDTKFLSAISSHTDGAVIYDFVDTGDNEKLKISAWTKEHHDTSGNVVISSYVEQQQKLYVKSKKHLDSKTTSILSTNFGMADNGILNLSSRYYYDILSTDDDNGSILTNDVSAQIRAGTDGKSYFRTISSLTTPNNQYEVRNIISMAPSGEIDKKTVLTISESIENGSASKFLKSSSESYKNTEAENTLKAYWNLTKTGNDSQRIKNSFQYSSTNKNNAEVLEQVISKKKLNDSDVVDFSTSRIIKAQESDVNLIIQDNITKNQIIFNNDCLKGQTTLHIFNKKSGNKCIMILDSNGKMTIQTSDQLDVQTTNSITMKSKSITLIGDDIKLDGPTTITKTLHVIGKTTIDPDAVIANKSFIGHIHGNGNMGSSTTPPV